MSGFFILKKAPGAAGANYCILLTNVCPLVGNFDVHCRHITSGRTR
ncbi:hypothetical protein HX037_08615 [Ignatzschineria indica]|nr:hypothetical protein [Ignatzschineria indica]MDM1545935.1 hypothetical protein [Ignatzschineria indica]